MAKTIVGMYDDHADASRTVEDLVRAGFERSQISLVASDAAGEYSSYPKVKYGEAGRHEEESNAGEGAAAGAVTGGLLGGLAGVLLGFGTLLIPGVGPIIAAGPIISGLVGAGIGATAGGLLGALVGAGIPKDKAEYYAEGVRRGGTLVMVNTPDEDVDRVIEIMERHNPVDVEERAGRWRETGWAGYDPQAEPYEAAQIREERERYYTRHAREGETTIPVVEEELRVGKRPVDRGAVRVHTHVESKPIEEDVHLREERVRVERHPVDQPAGHVGKEAFKESTFEVREKGEEAVVDKSARVVEEVVIKKDVGERTERVADTVRRTQVDVEQTGGARDVRGFDTDADYFRQHYQTYYAKSGGSYSDYEPAYRYGYTLGTDNAYNGRRRWDEVEPALRRRWETEYKGRGNWEKVKDAVRHGWDRVHKRT